MAQDDLNKHIQESLRDPLFRQAWEESELEYQVARQIIALRTQQGLTQKDLARQVGTTQSAIARIESGGQNVSLKLLARVAKALGASLEVKLGRQSN